MTKTYTAKLTRQQIYQICDALNAKAQVFAGYLTEEPRRHPVQTEMVWQQAINDYAAIRDNLLLAAHDPARDAAERRAANRAA